MTTLLYLVLLFLKMIIVWSTIAFLMIGAMLERSSLRAYNATLLSESGGELCSTLRAMSKSVRLIFSFSLACSIFIKAALILSSVISDSRGC